MYMVTIPNPLPLFESDKYLQKKVEEGFRNMFLKLKEIDHNSLLRILNQEQLTPKP